MLLGAPGLSWTMLVSPSRLSVVLRSPGLSSTLVDDRCLAWSLLVVSVFISICMHVDIYVGVMGLG